MSSPIARRSPSPSASSSSSSSGSSSQARGLYVPLHKRSAPSSTTSLGAPSEPSSSRPCSPSRRHTPGSPRMDPPQTGHPRIYTTGYLLSLRPFATEGLKDRMRAGCPEVVMNRRMRKSIEFNEHQARSASKREQLQQQQSPTLPPAFVHEEAHDTARDAAFSGTAPNHAPVSASPAHAATTPRATPRRTRPAGRAPERRRQALHHDAWHGLRGNGTHMPLVSV